MIDYVSEFVKNGADDGEFAFAVGGEAISEGFEARVVATSDHGGHEEGAAQVAVAFGADGGGMAEADPALTHARSDGQPGSGGGSSDVGAGASRETAEGRVSAGGAGS